MTPHQKTNKKAIIIVWFCTFRNLGSAISLYDVTFTEGNAP